ncbi:MAG: hypothetical protein ACFNUE_05250 [Bacteroides sp.]
METASVAKARGGAVEEKPQVITANKLRRNLNEYCEAVQAGHTVHIRQGKDTFGLAIAETDGPLPKGRLVVTRDEGMGMPLIRVTGSQFRNSIPLFCDMLRAGFDVQFTLGHSTFELVFVEEYVIASPEFREKLRRAEDDFRNGRFVTLRNPEELQNYLDNLKSNVQG